MLLQESSNKNELKEEIKDEGDIIMVDDDEDDILKNLGGDDDLQDLLNEETESNSDIFVPPTEGHDHLAQLVNESICPAYYVAIGEFKSAL